MNKTIAFLILGVILLAMALIMVNQYSTQQSEPLSLGAPNVPQKSLTQAGPASPGQLTPPPPSQSSALAQQAMPSPTPEAPPTATAIRPAVPQWATNLPEQFPVGGAPKPSPLADGRAGQNTPPAAIQPTAPASPLTQSSAPTQVPTASKAPVEKKEENKPQVKTEAPKPKAEKPKPKGPKTVKRINIFTADDAVTVRIDASEMPIYKTMQLNTPDRLVVDLQGEWIVKAPGVPNNKFVSNVRIGKQKDSTRIVIDLRQIPGSVRYVKKDASVLDIRFK